MKIFDLANLTASEGFRIDGAVSGENSGVSVCAAGDVNGDGYADVIIGANRASPYGRTLAGSSYVVYGKIGGYSLPIDLATFNTTTSFGFRIDGAEGGDFSGWSVSYAGDVNGDGLDDVITGAQDASPYGRYDAGSSYVVYGKRDGYSMPIDLATFNTTSSIGFRIDGAPNDLESGISVSSAGDVNGDGFADVVIGADMASPDNRSAAGSSYVVYGKKGGYNFPFDLATLNISTGFRIDGAQANSQSGTFVSYAGDVNGDGLADVIISAPLSYGWNTAGSSYVVYGNKDGYVLPIDLATFNATTSQGFLIQGAPVDDEYGKTVNAAGDVNGDGIDDVIIGSPPLSGEMRLVNRQAGSSYVVYGKKGSYYGPIDLATFNTNTSFGYRIDGAASRDFSGWSVSYAGDINGDGLDDVMIGAPYAGSQAGSSYIMYGKEGGYSLPFDLATLNTTTGFRIDGAISGDEAGYFVSSAGDVNGDGLSDMIIGAPYASPYGRMKAGSSYVVYGSYTPCDIINNTIILHYQNATVPPSTTLTTANLYASDHFYYSNDSQIEFTISDLIAGNFELISSGQTVTSFTQQQINEGDVRFVQDGSPNLPAYEVSVSNVKTATTTPQPASVTFIAPPFIIGNITNVPAAMNKPYQNAIDTTKIFKDSNLPLHFSATTISGNPLPNWVQFSVQDNATVTFESTTPLSSSLAGTTTTLSLIATNSYNLSNHADFNVTVPKPEHTKNLTYIIAGSTAGGVVGLAALAGSAFGFWRYRKTKQFAEERKNHTFANVVREKLQLSGIDDFQSNAGLAFINAIEVLINELQLQDIDVRNMYPNELEILSVYVANAIKTSVHITSSYFGIYKIVNPEDIQNNAGTIAKVTKALCQQTSHTPINESSYGTFKNG